MTTKESYVGPSVALAEKLNDSSINRVMAIDINWKIIAWNATSEVISGIKKTQVLGRQLTEVLPQLKENKPILDSFEKALAGHKVFLPADHTSFHREFYENHFIPLHNAHGEVIGAMNIMHDVSHRIKAERKLSRLNLELQKKNLLLQEANQDLSRFAYITTHDVKEPLRQVYTALELLIRKEAQGLSDASKGNLRRMQSSLNKMNLLLDDIITLSSICAEPRQFTQAPLTEVLKEVGESLKWKIEECGARIMYENLPVIRGYKNLLVALFTQLIGNAIKFHEPGNAPEVRISYNETSLPGDERKYISVIIDDNGIGFPAEARERIFRMFEKLHDRRFHGTGIGLTIAKKIMETHEGLITGEPLEKGARFTCYFPVEDESV